MTWEAVKQADRDHTDALNALETAQASTKTAEEALTNAQTTYEAAKQAERAAEDTAEAAQAHLIEVSKEVNVDFPPDNPPAQSRR